MSEFLASAELRLSSAVSDLPNIQRSQVLALGRLGIQTISGLLRHLPMRYQREAAECSIAQLKVDSVGSVRGSIIATRWVPPLRRGRKGRFEATLEDESNEILLTWFNAGYLRQALHPGMTLRVHGKVKLYEHRLQIINPRWEQFDDEAEPEPHCERLCPIYPATERLPSYMIERLVAEVLPWALPLVIDPLPPALLEHHAMPQLAESYTMAHQPQDEQQAAAARRRLAFNELLLVQLGIFMKRAYVRRQLVAPALHVSDAIDCHIRQRFPFELTLGQSQVIEEIKADLVQSRPMNRLLQGDVGSGKTVVALYALLAAVANRKQGVLMAPTELLAEQHYLSISQLLGGSSVQLVLVTGGQANSRSVRRAAVLEQIQSGQADIVIGTHALLTDALKYHDLAVAVIDEQHRFGVVQRAGFRAAPQSHRSQLQNNRRPQVPHHLVMTATPIPRTLSLTIFGDLDVSVLRDRPPGRTSISNRLVGPDQSDEVYRYLVRRLERGEQAYIVVPTINAEGRETSQQLKSVREHARLLQERYCHNFKVEAIHGRLKRQTRSAIMQKFREGQVQVLVATSVIEVGVDVPNATMMVIEHADRFGLASLHQLRGRIGRGTHGRQSVCIFIAEPTTDEAQERLGAINSTTDGFKIAEMDFQIRGMGEFFGTRQHGLPPLRVAQLPQDMDLLKLARIDAAGMIEQDPQLLSRGHQALRRVLFQHYGEAMGLIDVG